MPLPSRSPIALGVLLAALLAVASVATVVAQSAAGFDVLVADNPEYGPILTNADGKSLYLYLQDEGGASTCVDACVTNWPPLLIADGAAPVGGEGVDASLLGTTTRADGGVQVTYAGWPLYTFRRDAEPGQTRGHKLGEAFFLVAPTGDAVGDKLPQEAVQIDPDLMSALMSEGAQTFASNCAVCHGPEGGGGIGPALAGNTVLADGAFVVKRVLDGFIEHGMPSFRAALSDRQIAGVVTFVRNSWGNELGAVLEEEVAGLR